MWCLQLDEEECQAGTSASLDSVPCKLSDGKIFTDQGRNFESNLFRSVCESLNINKSRTTPYHPSSNGQVERYNRTLLNAVRCYLQGRQDRWDECVPFIAAALRVNRNTGFTPNRFVLGREVTTPLELMFPLPRTAAEGPLLDSYVSSLSGISNKHMLKPVRP
ncbi:Pol polyprotein [Plakobranchus ocellatus]|uniref:Pol polyprotein n=1 Tax=Plakobranchus ocellatus TaxID=259542 RepID=A0AAV3ZAX3_9GAST|nr:Pol polyprotein [Plakobranchus ocellatus]